MRAILSPIDDPDLWARRRRRAEEHTRRLVAEWERAREKRQGAKWVAYEYEREDEDAASNASAD